MIELLQLLFGATSYGFTPEEETDIVRLAVMVGAIIGAVVGRWHP